MWTVLASTQVERNGQPVVNTDIHFNQALLYLYHKGTEEAFHKAKEVSKMGYEVEGVIMSRDRLLQVMDFQETAELDLERGAMGIRTSLPVLDRYSPLRYAVGQYIYWGLPKNKGAESCDRLNIEQIHILQGAGL